MADQSSHRTTWPPEAMTAEEIDAIRDWAERHRNDWQAEPIAAIALQGVLPRLLYEVTALRTAYTLLAEQLVSLAERAETAEAERDDARDFVFYDGDEDEDDEDIDLDGPHSDMCCCEDCLQNHPERDVLYNDSQYYGDDDDEDLTDDEG